MTDLALALVREHNRGTDVDRWGRLICEADRLSNNGNGRDAKRMLKVADDYFVRLAHRAALRARQGQARRHCQRAPIIRRPNAARSRRMRVVRGASRAGPSDGGEGDGDGDASGNCSSRADSCWAARRPIPRRASSYCSALAELDRAASSAFEQPQCGVAL